MTTTVSLEAARALQGVGFDLPTIWYYDQYGDGPIELRTKRELPAICPAPDILQAVMWLWEKYGFWCCVNHSSKFFLAAVQGSKRNRREVGNYNNPITAYNAAIQFACEWAKKQKR